MINHFLIGLRLVLTGFRLIFKKGIRPFVIVPFLINLFIFSGAIWLGWQWFTRLLDSMLNWLPSWLDWLQWLIWPLAVFSVVVMVYYSFTVLANVIAAPFNSLLSERAEALISGQTVPEFQGFASIPGMLVRTLWAEARKAAYQLKWLIALIILSFIPVLNLVAPLAWLWFGAWMLSIEYGEYPMGNHGYYFAKVKTTLKSDRATAMGMGFGLMLLTMIPLLNFLAMPVGVVGGTVFWVKRLKALDSSQ